MSNKPKTQPDPQPAEAKPTEAEVKPAPQPAEPTELKPIEYERRPRLIVALHDNALIGQVTFAAGTVLAQVTPVRGVTLEQICSAILHGKVGVPPGA